MAATKLNKLYHICLPYEGGNIFLKFEIWFRKEESTNIFRYLEFFGIRKFCEGGEANKREGHR
jgi:hypothetical protein